MSQAQLFPILLSLKVAVTATLLVLLVGGVAAWGLARREFRGKRILETLIQMPLVLPPTVLGFYLLMLLGRRSPLGAWLEAHHLNPIFTWGAAVLASAVVAFPLLVNTAQAALESVDPRLEKAARTLGASEWRAWLTVTLPLAWRGILAAVVLAFARSLGEFGATLMVAGNIPGRTQTIPLAIYSAVTSGDYAQANLLVMVMTVVAFAVIWAVITWQKGLRQAREAH